MSTTASSTRRRTPASDDAPPSATAATAATEATSSGKAGKVGKAAKTGGEGLSIRPQTLHLTPQYRHLRDTILRPHLRLTESRYFWERWKPLLGPDATVLIMEVRDRCNRALAAGTGEEALPAEGCTVSANELAAACGFSRVTLWRLLQRDDVRQFVSVEHNYIYDQRLGKRRRTVSTYHVLMEDPLVLEDEPRLQQLLERHGLGAALADPPALGVLAAPSLPAEPPTLHSETKVLEAAPPTLHSETTNSRSKSKPQNVFKTNLEKRLGTGTTIDRGGDPVSLGSFLHNALEYGFLGATGNQLDEAPVTRETGSVPTGSSTPPLPVPPTPRAPSGHAPGGGKKLGLDLWEKYPDLAHFVEEAETQLGDQHSRGFYVTALKRLYPEYMDIWQRALALAREQQNIRRSRGALFTRLLRTFATEAGISL